MYIFHSLNNRKCFAVVSDDDDDVNNDELSYLSLFDLTLFVINVITIYATFVRHFYHLTLTDIQYTVL